MLYKFKSKAGSDLIMMGPNGDEILRFMGRAPSAKGIIEPADMPAAIQALEQAVAEEEIRLAGRERADADVDADEACDSQSRSSGVVSLRQRIWPLIDLMKRAHAAGHDIVWGV